MLADMAPPNRIGEGIVVTSITPLFATFRHSKCYELYRSFPLVISPMPRGFQRDSREGLGLRFLLCNQVVVGRSTGELSVFEAPCPS